MVIPIGIRKNWFKYFQYEEGKDTPSDIRNILLIIFTLVAAVTFQAGINPPGGVWQDGEKAGRAIYASQKKAYYVFLIFNTLAFSNSILVILSLTHKFPFNFEIWVATISMAVTYGSSVFAVTPGNSVRFRYVLITAAGPFVLRISASIFGLLLRKYVPHHNELSLGHG
ncbi:uncharacterized protein LOC130973759 [Arachis stenosperma]|uniref:uncharacterized protein LOC130973759 n=1 Tax=Arachis stenosperma TaxID=217475 RepID=UPI0025AB65E2|nr:uncharacterized protein LOC130973759 [Arachis stenosperma]